MTVPELLVELESLTHSGRVKRMIELGRLAVGTSNTPSGDPLIAGLLKSLGAGGSYERRLALYASLGSRDGTFAAAGIADPSALVRNLAGSLVPHLCDDSTVVRLLDAADPRRRLQLVRGLGRRSRRIPIDSFLDAAVARRERNWVELLPYGSRSCVTRHAGAFSAEASPAHWRRLGRNHPAICAELLTAIANGAGSLDARLRANAQAVLEVLGARVPDAAVVLVKSLARHLSLSQLCPGTLVIRCPNEVARLLLENQTAARFGFGPVAYRLESELLVAMLARYPHSFSRPQRWLGRLPRDQRQTIYELCALAWRERDGSLAPQLVALLPDEIRQREGQRHLNLPTLATQPARRIAYAAFLPWTQMRSIVDPLLRDPDADTRGAALASLITAGRFDRERLEEILALLATRANEQDPVRLVMLTALHTLPPSRWKSDHLAQIGLILRHALDAADASHATGLAAEQIVVRLIPFHPDWARQWLATIIAQRGMLVSSLFQNLSDQQVAHLAPALLPVFQSWQTREREGYLINAARLLGRRLRVFHAMADILESIVKSSANDFTSESALAILSDERHDRFSRLVPELLKQDPTWATRRVVYGYLDLHRQDLLAPCMGRVPYRGRFSTGQTRFFLPFVGNFLRWTPSQQATLALTLHEVTEDRERENPAILSVIHQLAAMPDIEPKRLIELAGLDQSRLAVRDAALRALGQLDAAQGVPTLLEALADDRARIAIYGLRRALLQMPAAVALKALVKAPMAQVTVAKEVVRLVGELRTQDAFVQLLEYDKRNLHRDVRAALLRALWSFLDRDESWEILQRAVASGEPGQADVASRIPADTLNADGQLRLADLLAALLAHQDAKVRVNVLRRLMQLPLVDARRAILPGLLSAIASVLPEESALAASALFATYAGRQADVVGEVTLKLLSHRQALHTLVESLCAALPDSGSALTTTARAVLSALSTDALTITLRVGVAVLILPPDELAAFFTDAAASGTLHADALEAAMKAMSQLLSLQGPKAMNAIEVALAGSADERLRRLGFAALTAATERNQAWNEDQLAKLAKYRGDPSPLVAGAAQFTFPVPETEVMKRLETSLLWQ